MKPGFLAPKVTALFLGGSPIESTTAELLETLLPYLKKEGFTVCFLQDERETLEGIIAQYEQNLKRDAEQIESLKKEVEKIRNYPASCRDFLLHSTDAHTLLNSPVFSKIAFEIQQDFSKRLERAVTVEEVAQYISIKTQHARELAQYEMQEVFIRVLKAIQTQGISYRNVLPPIDQLSSLSKEQIDAHIVKALKAIPKSITCTTYEGAETYVKALKEKAITYVFNAYKMAPAKFFELGGTNLNCSKLSMEEAMLAVLVTAMPRYYYIEEQYIHCLNSLTKHTWSMDVGQQAVTVTLDDEDIAVPLLSYYGILHKKIEGAKSTVQLLVTLDVPTQIAIKEAFKAHIGLRISQLNQMQESLLNDVIEWCIFRVTNIPAHQGLAAVYLERLVNIDIKNFSPDEKTAFMQNLSKIPDQEMIYGLWGLRQIIACNYETKDNPDNLALKQLSQLTSAPFHRLILDISAYVQHELSIKLHVLKQQAGLALEEAKKAFLDKEKTLEPNMLAYGITLSLDCQDKDKNIPENIMRYIANSLGKYAYPKQHTDERLPRTLRLLSFQIPLPFTLLETEVSVKEVEAYRAKCISHWGGMIQVEPLTLVHEKVLTSDVAFIQESTAGPFLTKITSGSHSLRLTTAEQLLLSAIKNADVEGIYDLLKNHKVNMGYRNGSLLYWSIANGLTPITETLLQKGAEVEKKHYFAAGLCADEQTGKNQFDMLQKHLNKETHIFTADRLQSQLYSPILNSMAANTKNLKETIAKSAVHDADFYAAGRLFHKDYSTTKPMQRATEIFNALKEQSQQKVKEIA